MRDFVHFAFYTAVGGLIFIQRDVTGELLVTGWHGLALAGVLCAAGIAFALRGLIEEFGL